MTNAGTEIGVASTKAFTTQLTVLLMLVAKLSRLKGLDASIEHVIGMFIFPSIIALIVGFIGLRYGSDSPESYGLGKAEELFGE
ncbi:hypothetical protein, partial [Escherichia coli]|uniref:hypothetical protein n=1 Tax=Escherichia coli TaxID=562 RepID=UPI0015851C4B